MNALEKLLYFIRRRGEVTAFYRLHNGNQLSVFPRDLIVCSGGYFRVFPVSVVNLQLDEINLRMHGQQLVKQCRRAVKRKANVSDQAFFLLLVHKIPQMELVISLIVVFLQRMKQVIIKIAGACSFQTGIKLLLGGSFCCGNPGVQLCRQCIRVTGMAFDQSLSDSCFGTRINKGGIKVSKSGIQKQIDHDLDLLNIDYKTPPGKTHQAKAELGRVFTIYY